MSLTIQQYEDDLLDSHLQDEEEWPRFWLDQFDRAHDRDNHNRFAPMSAYEEQERENRSNHPLAGIGRKA